MAAIAAVGQRHVGGERGRAGAVDDGDVADQRVAAVHRCAVLAGGGWAVTLL